MEFALNLAKYLHYAAETAILLVHSTFPSTRTPHILNGTGAYRVRNTIRIEVLQLDQRYETIFTQYNTAYLQLL